MYTVFYYKNNECTERKVDDLRTACIMGFNSVCYLGYEMVIVMDNETGEIVREYCKG